MEITIKSKKGTVKKRLLYRKTEVKTYAVIVGDKEIGTVYLADGRVMKFRNHRLDGTKWADRWFAKTPEGTRLGPESPYDEGFDTRREATIELVEIVLKIRRDPDSY